MPVSDALGFEIGEVVCVRVEVPRGSFVKRSSAGHVDYVAPLPSPFNYGSVPGTRAPDGEPVDALLLGPRRPRDHEARCAVRAVVCFVDAGVPDPKLVCAPWSPSERELAIVAGFFRAYAVLKGTLNRLRGVRGRTAYEGLVRG
jgi:inorganic pyrophosphatase